MKRFFHISFALIYLCFLLTSCKETVEELEPTIPEDKTEEVKRTILVYAINRSSLASDFVDDSHEMLKALDNIDFNSYRLLLYRTDSDTECGLYRAERNLFGDMDFTKIKDYKRNVTSTHPDRIKEVIDDALAMYPNAAYDLVLWGHGMSWRPDFSDHEVVVQNTVYGYGGEYNPNNYNLDWTGIDELALALPDRRFETIWFDCCYMAGIEVIYQLRHKCDTFVGYPTEVWQYGMQYDHVLPYLMREKPDVVGGAKAFYDVYVESKDPVTVAVIDMSKIELVADAAHDIIHSGDNRPDYLRLLNYSRSSKWPFYDLRQFLALTAECNESESLISRLDDAMSQAVIYHAESERDFNSRPWDITNISGVSIHYYQGLDTEAEDFYRTLDWYKRVH